MKRKLFLLIGLLIVVVLMGLFAPKGGYYPDQIDFVRFQDLLRAQKFDQLNKELDKLQKEFEADFRSEYRLADAYNAFGLTSPDLEVIFNKWVEEYPTHYQAYIARSQYYHRLGWNARGYGIAAETSREQFEKMDSYFKQGYQDAKKALELKKDCFMPYLILIGINGAADFSDSIADLVQAGLKINPYSLILRSRYLWFVQPKWGGSILEMEDFIKQTEKYFPKNPSLKLLKGFPHMTGADTLRYAGQYDKAEELYKKALSYGNYHLYLWGRAANFIKLKKNKMAFNAINTAIKLYPRHMYFYQLRGMLHLLLGDQENALKDHNRFNRIFPYRNETREYNRWFSDYFVSKAYKSFEKGDIEPAFATIGTAISLDKTNHKAIHWRGIFYIRTRNPALAFQDFTKAIEIDPTHYISYKGIDDVLVRQKKFNLIIQYWIRYINLVPANADAYLERSGTYYRKGEFDLSLEDARKAAELKKEYQANYDKLKIKIDQMK